MAWAIARRMRASCSSESRVCSRIGVQDSPGVDRTVTPLVSNSSMRSGGMLGRMSISPAASAVSAVAWSGTIRNLTWSALAVRSPA